ncbi:MAG: cytochrome c, partial [Myxococcota bacterium]
PSLHDDRIRSMPDGQLYATITNGIRAMPGYSHSVPQDDRWAIVTYVRALQLSQLSLQAQNGAAGTEDAE